MVIEVQVPSGSYAVHLESDLTGLGRAVAGLAPSSVFVVTNPIVGPLYRDQACASLRSAGLPVFTLEIPDGEAHKTLSTWRALVEGLLAAGIDRAAVVVALGGGVTGDIVGFAAAAALRGVRVVQVPTTLLAMVDSAIGGKTGVNTDCGKNLVGAFHQPAMVFAAMQTLSTLDDAEYRGGLGEVIKHGAIRDEALLRLCRDEAAAVLARDTPTVLQLVERSCRIKAAIVVEDERERGARRLLNAGHTVGHALETALGHGVLRHGECVAIGLLTEARWACGRGTAPQTVVDDLLETMQALQVATVAPPVDRPTLRHAAGSDKKRTHGMLQTPVLEALGKARIEAIPEAEVISMLNELEIVGEK